MINAVELLQLTYARQAAAGGTLKANAVAVLRDLGKARVFLAELDAEKTPERAAEARASAQGARAELDAAAARAEV